MKKLLNLVRFAIDLTSPWRLARICSLSVFSGFLDLLGVFAVVPLIYLLLSPSTVDDHPLLRSLTRAVGVSDHTGLMLFGLTCFLALIVFKNAVGLGVIRAQLAFCYDIASIAAERGLRLCFARGYQSVATSDHSHVWRSIMVLPTAFAAILQGALMLTTELAVLGLIALGLAVYSGGALALLLLVVAPFATLFYRLVRTRVRRLGEQTAELYPLANKHLLETLRGFAEIELLAKEQFFIARFAASRTRLNENEAKSQLYGLAPVRFIEILACVAVTTLIIFHVLRHDTPSVIVASLTVFTAAAYRLMPSGNRILASLIRIRTHSYALDDLHAFTQPLEKADSAEWPTHLDEEIRLSGIRYTYPGASSPSLSDLSLEIRKGECIGIVGPSGAGKTTLLKLLLRFVQEESGSFMVDGRILESANVTAWRRLLGYVPQEVFVLDDTLKRNVALGEQLQDISENRVREALRDASLLGLLGRLPKGLDTRLGEGGALLSGGERQRIAIARAFYHHAEVLVFDEMTSALDRDTERLVLESIHALNASGRTVVIIAHRHSTLRYCDRIFHLQEGAVSRVTSYEQLRESSTGA